MVIVYWRGKVKFAAYGTTPPERFAPWLLQGICLKVETTDAIAPSYDIRDRPNVTWRARPLCLAGHL